MKQILVQLDEPLARHLEEAVPGRSRKRSEFIRKAIIEALYQLNEEKARRSYAEHPQEDVPWPDEDWLPPAKVLKRKRPRPRK